MIKRREEIQVTFKFSERTDQGVVYPVPRRLSVCFYGGDPEEAIRNARKIFQLGSNWVLEEVKGEDA